MLCSTFTANVEEQSDNSEADVSASGNVFSELLATAAGCKCKFGDSLTRLTGDDASLEQCATTDDDGGGGVERGDSGRDCDCSAERETRSQLVEGSGSSAPAVDVDVAELHAATSPASGFAHDLAPTNTIFVDLLPDSARVPSTAVGVVDVAVGGGLLGSLVSESERAH